MRKLKKMTDIKQMNDSPVIILLPTDSPPSIESLPLRFTSKIWVPEGRVRRNGGYTTTTRKEVVRKRTGQHPKGCAKEGMVSRLA